MGLTRSESATIEKARTAGNADLAEDLDDATCVSLIAVIAEDLGLTIAGLPKGAPDFFRSAPDSLRLEGVSFDDLIVRALELDRDVVTYFACLAKLHKARVKYARILRSQPIPTMDQVGPRGLLQYGSMSPRALTGFLLWRKWLYDIDNRAAQETGYLFEPIIAHSVGGVPHSASKSPIRRSADKSKGRQVDCVIRKRAYEIKLRVTIAASGQGRWREETEFPSDCETSGYTPVLVVFDPTPNPKLGELTKVFVEHGGEVFIGKDAWTHLDSLAGPTMARFLDKYVRDPLSALLREFPDDGLPKVSFAMSATELCVSVGRDQFVVARQAAGSNGKDEKLPDDVDDTITGP